MGDENSIEHINELVRGAQGGDEDSLGCLYELLSDRVYRYIVMRVSHRETAEDLMQTAFLEMIRSLPRYKIRVGAKFTTWLFQIVRHRLIDHYRRQKIVLPMDEAVESHPALQTDPAPPDMGDSDKHLLSAIAALPERQQTILHLYYREDMSPSEIAEVMDISVISVRVEKHRAISKIRHLFSEGDTIV
ncbi:MAG: RNA polymerase sigma factor [Parcubacteria group bacterium]